MHRSLTHAVAYALLLVSTGCGLILDLGGDVDPGGVDAGDAGDRVDARSADGGGGSDARIDAPADAATADARAVDAEPSGDAATSCPAPCGLVAQCGCGPAEACQYAGVTGVHCATAGTAPAGSYCTAETQCARGLSCIWIYGVRNGVCVAFCDEDADCGGSARCVEIPMVDQAGVCSFACDPLNATSCPADVQTCDVILRTTFEGTPSTPVTVCRTVGSSGAGSACMTATDCVAETTCRAGTCRSFCDVARPTCPAGTACTGRWLVGGVEYGLCE